MVPRVVVEPHIGRADLRVQLARAQLDAEGDGAAAEGYRQVVVLVACRKSSITCAMRAK